MSLIKAKKKKKGKPLHRAGLTGDCVMSAGDYSVVPLRAYIKP